MTLVCSVLSSPTWFDSGFMYIRQSRMIRTMSTFFHTKSIWETTCGKRLRIELATTRGRDTTVPIYRWSLFVLISTTGGLAPRDQTPQLNWSLERGPKDPKGDDPRTDQVTMGLPHSPGLASRRDRFLSNCLSLSLVSWIGTDTTTTYGHLAFDAQDCGVGTPPVIRHL